MTKLKRFLHNIRSDSRKTPVWKFLLCCVGFLALGAALGVFSKYVDAANFRGWGMLGLPGFVKTFLTEMLSMITSGITFWIFLGVVICRLTKNPFRAAAYVLLLCAGMIPAYYLFAEIAGLYYSRAYIRYWSVFAAFTPIMSVLSWYACGRGKTAWVLRIGLLVISVLGGIFVSGSFVNIFIGIAAFFMTFIGRKGKDDE